MSEREFLKNLKIGDKVFVSSRNGISVGIVQRFTATQIVLESGSKFNIKSGCRIGDTVWNFTNLEEFNEEEWTQIKLNSQFRKSFEVLHIIKIPEKKISNEKKIEFNALVDQIMNFDFGVENESNN